MTADTEGLALGHADKGLGERLTLPYGEVIYLSGIDWKKGEDLEGRLVRIIGTLTIEHQKAARMLKDSEGEVVVEQGYGTAFDYFNISVSKVTLIDKVTLRFPKRR